MWFSIYEAQTLSTAHLTRFWVHRMNSAGRYPSANSGSESRRVGVFSIRNLARQVSRTACYEFEDLITSELEPGASLIEPVEAPSHNILARARNWSHRKGIKKTILDRQTPQLPVDHNLDLLFFAPAVPYDLLALENFGDWRDRTSFAVCLIQEFWLSELDQQLTDLQYILDKFDLVICCFYHTAEELSHRLSAEVAYAPHCVDADLFNPYNLKHTPRRVIDACAVGDMDPLTHRSLWDWAAETGRYYNFTTLGGAKLSVHHGVHRQNLAQTLQRSRYFFTYMAKRTATKQRTSQEEFGSRFFEGAAAGAIQLGDIVTSNPGFMANLDWDGAVIESEYRSKDVPALISKLEGSPGWVESVRRRNVANCLLRHDHLYRWDIVLKAARFEESSSAAARRARLRAQADAISETALEATNPA